MSSARRKGRAATVEGLAISAADNARVRDLGPPDGLPTYDEALGMVMGLADFERSKTRPGHSTFHLERMELLMQRLGNAHLATPTVHVAGTKGKGSTSAMVASILAAQGHTVGLFTSPHLHRATERIRVGMTPISEDDFASIVARIWPTVLSLDEEGPYGPATTFEALTAMAFVHFASIGADFQVMEVGLGGRLDSTNIVRPEVCAITSISLDHVSILGDTVEKIAFEKAGIIKPGVPVVAAPNSDAAMEVIARVAEERGAPLVRVETELSVSKLDSDFTGQSFVVEGLRGTYRLRTPLLGDHQLANAATAVAAAESLPDRYAVPESSIVSGIADVRWPARLDVLSTNGSTLVVDGAHNPHSMARLAEAVRDIFRFNRVILIFGSLGGHSAEGMADAIAHLSPVVVAVRSRHPRSAPSEGVAELFESRGLPVAYRTEDVGEGTRHALEMAGDGDLVLGTGSLTVAAEVIEYVRGISPELYPTIKLPPSRGAPDTV